jgi:hypothetical protein
MPDNADKLTWRFPGIGSSDISGFRKRTETAPAWHVLSIRCLALLRCHLVGGLTCRVLYASPLTPPVGTEASQATRSLTGEKGDIEPSESVDLELVAFSIGS